VTRRVKKLREKGVEGIKHGNFQSIPSNRLLDGKREQMLALATKLYFDFNICHCLEMLESNHNLSVSYSTFHRWCRSAGIGKRKRRRTSKSRVYRERMACEGLLLQMDGSHHRWNGKDEWCLIALIDDATSEIPAARFFEGETTIGCMTVLRAAIEAHGVPQMIYTDEAGWAGGSMKRQHFSQFVRACEELGIRVLTTSSAQSKGRIERLWNTTQDRLVPELRLAGIKGMLDANRYINHVYLPKYWQVKNTVVARDSSSKYRPLLASENLDEIFCLKFTRQIHNDQTISFEARKYKVTDREYGSLAKKDVSIHQYADGTLGFFYGHLQLNCKEVFPPRRAWERKGA
jgi:transposase-like protein